MLITVNSVIINSRTVFRNVNMFRFVVYYNCKDCNFVHRWLIMIYRCKKTLMYA